LLTKLLSLFVEGEGAGDAEADVVDGEEVLTQTDTYADFAVAIIGGVIVVGMVPMDGGMVGGPVILL
jgi:hypothetical protein